MVDGTNLRNPQITSPRIGRVHILNEDVHSPNSSNFATVKSQTSFPMAKYEKLVYQTSRPRRYQCLNDISFIYKSIQVMFLIFPPHGVHLNYFH